MKSFSDRFELYWSSQTLFGLFCQIFVFVTILLFPFCYWLLSQASELSHFQVLRLSCYLSIFFGLIPACMYTNLEAIFRKRGRFQALFNKFKEKVKSDETLEDMEESWKLYWNDCLHLADTATFPSLKHFEESAELKADTLRKLLTIKK